MSEPLSILQRVDEAFRHLCRNSAAIQHLGPTINLTRLRISPETTKIVQHHKAPISKKPDHLVAPDSFRKLLILSNVVKAAHCIHELFITRRAAKFGFIQPQYEEPTLVKARGEKNI